MDKINHCFGPNQTIDAIITLKNRHNVSKEELLDLRSWYNVMNRGHVPKPGDTVKIPILDRHKQHYTLKELGKAR
jgi:hypothetical protein